ncbi:CHASE domain-containing protein [Marinobacter zhejiangensis]|uniref:CHASE domain-containing protein n=1 Tax=Marinobacter zhejiangensis TaxID=488535 RepID=A0A1I4LEN7_9GAMM|nr:CHASE domain-containing protein [Marinobacter zhejiangensis]SFL89538.1 CHASE domain-containing protein [Marinobacter zhejiangensis]
MPRAPRQGFRFPRRLLLLPGLPLLLLVIILVATAWLAQTARDEGRTLTNQLLATRQLGHAARFDAHFSLLVASARGMAAGHIGNATEFRQRANALLAQHPTLLGVELIRRIPHDRREQVEQQMSAELNQYVPFRQWQQLVANVPLEPRDDYLVVRWSYARSDIEENGISPGLLALSVPQWRRDLQTAFEQQTVTTTPLTALDNESLNGHSLRIFVPVSQDDVISIDMDPTHWLGGLFGAYQDPRVRFTVHDLNQHNKTPLYLSPAEGSVLSERALRSEVAAGNRHWMITTLPTKGLYLQANTQTVRRVWMTGLIIALAAAAALTTLLLLRQFYRRRLTLAEKRQNHLDTRQQNLEVEKTILHKALEESGHRTRDLIGLAGGFVAELDERGRTGFVSEQVSDLLDLPPSTLMEQPFETHVAPDSLESYQATLAAARETRAIERADLNLLTDTRRALPVTLRVKAIADPVHGFTGYRLSVIPRQ